MRYSHNYFTFNFYYLSCRIILRYPLFIQCDPLIISSILYNAHENCASTRWARSILARVDSDFAFAAVIKFMRVFALRDYILQVKMVEFVHQSVSKMSFDKLVSQSFIVRENLTPFSAASSLRFVDRFRYRLLIGTFFYLYIRIAITL